MTELTRMPAFSFSDVEAALEENASRIDTEADKVALESADRLRKMGMFIPETERWK